MDAGQVGTFANNVLNHARKNREQRPSRVMCRHFAMTKQLENSPIGVIVASSASQAANVLKSHINERKITCLIGTTVLLTTTMASAQSSGPGMGFFSGGGGGTFTPEMQKRLNDYVRRACAKGDPVLHDMGSCTTSARRTKRGAR
jgi:hypothetical protein